MITTLLTLAPNILGIAKELFPDHGLDKIEDLMNLSPQEQERLTNDQRVQVLISQERTKQVEATAHADTVKALAEAETNGSSTRPAIALFFARIIGWSFIAIMAFLGYGVVVNPDIITSFEALWPIALSFLIPMTACIRAFFGLRSADKVSRQRASMGMEPLQQESVWDKLGKIVGK